MHRRRAADASLQFVARRGGGAIQRQFVPTLREASSTLSPASSASEAKSGYTRTLDGAPAARRRSEMPSGVSSSRIVSIIKRR